MANNRMYLVHGKTGNKIMLAKYYPTTGWYVKNEGLAGDLNKFFNRADFGKDEWPNSPDPSKPTEQFSSGGMWGHGDWKIELEIEESA